MAKWAARTLIPCSVIIVFVLLSPAPAFGNSLTVTSTADSGPGSLRDAIASASPGDTVVMSVAGTISLTTGPLAVTTDLTIVGPGSSKLAIDGGHVSRVFTVAGSGAISVAISGVTIQNGSASSGGGVFNRGTLTLTDTVLSGNAADSSGGAIYNAPGATLHVIGSRVIGNVAPIGGGINDDDGIVTIADSTLTHNSAVGGYAGFGGAISSRRGTYAGAGEVEAVDIRNSTISFNTASDKGGAIFHGIGILTITNSTVANNSCSSKRAADDCGCFGGGGIYNVIGTVRIDNSTIAGNSSFPSGGSITSLYGPTTLSRTILAKGPTGPNCYYTNILGGRIVSDGYNISDDASCSSVLTGPGDLNETSAGLSPSGLQNNGGATETIQLLSTSAAVDSVPLEACAVSDQRGVTRPQGAACDVGAYERVPSPYTAGIQQPIKVDGTTTFSANRGVVPVKFALSYNGSPTCQLPPAAISLAQTAGPATGPLDDGAYLMPADVGASFRIDAGSCQYVYNLGTDALSTGTYAVSISIDGLVIGTATFGIR